MFLFLPGLCAAVGVSSAVGGDGHHIPWCGQGATQPHAPPPTKELCLLAASVSPRPDCTNSHVAFPSPRRNAASARGAQREPLSGGRGCGAGGAPAAGSVPRVTGRERRWHRDTRGSRGGHVAAPPRGGARSRPRPCTAAGTQRRHVRAAGSWQVNKN